MQAPGDMRDDAKTHVMGYATPAPPTPVGLIWFRAVMIMLVAFGALWLLLVAAFVLDSNEPPGSAQPLPPFIGKALLFLMLGSPGIAVILLVAAVWLYLVYRGETIV